MANRGERDNLNGKGQLGYPETLARETRTETRTETRAAAATNAYTSIQHDGLADPVTPIYDTAGNLLIDPLAKNIEPHSLTGQEYTYDEENRVVSIRIDTNGQSGPAGEAKVLEFKYDALGRRIETIQYNDEQSGERLTDGAISPVDTPRRTRHVYSDLEMIQEYEVGVEVGEGFAPGGGDTPPTFLKREFLWGDSERFPEPTAMIVYNTGPNNPAQVYYYLRDVLGSVVAMTNSLGDFLERYTYDPYGKTYIERWDSDNNQWLPNESPTGMSYSILGNPFLWTGQRYDSVAGTYHFPCRTYSSTLGRWLQRDPLEYIDGPNLYEYAQSSPETLVDSFGENACNKECDRLAVACKATGVDHRRDPSFNFRHDCERCRKACNKNCQKKKKANDEMPDCVRDGSAKADANDWWNKSKCGQRTDSWRYSVDPYHKNRMIVYLAPQPTDDIYWDLTECVARKMGLGLLVGEGLKEGGKHLLENKRVVKLIGKGAAGVATRLIGPAFLIHDLYELHHALKECLEELSGP